MLPEFCPNPNCGSKDVEHTSDTSLLDWFHCKACGLSQCEPKAKVEPVASQSKAEPVALDQIRADIQNAFRWQRVHCSSWQANKAARTAESRVLAHIEALSTPEGLVAEVRRTMAGMKPGSRLDVIDSLCAGYCVHCGDAVKDVCHCANDE